MNPDREAKLNRRSHEGLKNDLYNVSKKFLAVEAKGELNHAYSLQGNEYEIIHILAQRCLQPYLAGKEFRRENHSDGHKAIPDFLRTGHGVGRKRTLR